MPQYIWEDIFPILNILVPGVIMALFAAYYQNRRKREIKVEGKLAIDRINGYENMLACFYEGQKLHEVTLQEEERAKEILGYFNVETFHCECPNAFIDEDSFDAFYKQLQELQRDYQIYLDDKVSRKLDRSVGIYTRLKLWLDAFSDTEHVVDLKVKQDVARKHIDWVYKLTGMLMFSHATRAYAQLDQVICKQMNRLSLTYRKHRIRRFLRKVGEAIVHWIDVHAHNKGLVGRLCKRLLWLYIDKEDKDMVRITETAIHIMQYVHFSDRFTPQEYFEGKRIPREDEVALYKKVFWAMIHKS